MSFLKPMIVVGLVLAMTGIAGAITFDQPFTGPIKMKFSNYDSGRVYVGPDGTYTANSGPNGLTLTDLKNTPFTPGASFGSIAPPGGEPGEDGWGLFELTSILGQDPSTGQFNIVLWEKGGVTDTKPDIVGMFYGLQDAQVTLSTRPEDGLKVQEVWATGDNFKVDLYEVPNGSAILKGPEARTSLSTFPGWTVGTPVLQGVGLADQIVTPTPPAPGLKYWSQTILNPTTGGVVARSTAEGSAKLFVEWIGGTAFDTFHIEGPDMEFTTHVYGNDTNFNWTTSTDDPAFGGVVPEPITMLGVMLAVGGIGTYIRQRKH